MEGQHFYDQISVCDKTLGLLRAQITQNILYSIKNKLENHGLDDYY
jgi:hypothetical protein